MIGLSSIWPKLFFLLVFSVFLTAFIKSWSEVARKKAAATGKLLFFSAFFLLWGFMFTQLFVREALFHHDLSGIRVDTLKSIEVGTRSINAPEDISEVVRSLNEAQWFESNHGGWADEVPFVIHFRSGERRTYHVASYLRQQGAVLISMSNFDRNGRGVGWSNGIAFCPRLLGALAASGVYLPRPERAEQQKNQNAESGKAASERWNARVVPIAIFGFFTLSALAVFRRLVNGQGPVSHTVGSSYAGLRLVTTIAGLAFVSVIAAGSSLRVMHALFDWPDPTNMGTVLSVWLAMLSGGIIVLLLRHRKAQQSPNL